MYDTIRYDTAVNMYIVPLFGMYIVPVFTVLHVTTNDSRLATNDCSGGEEGLPSPGLP